MILDDYDVSGCRWLVTEGPYWEAVISSRVRLARNLRGIPFSHHAGEDDLDRIDRAVSDVLAAHADTRQMEIIHLDHLTATDRMFLSERHLISHEMVEGGAKRAVGVGPGEQISVMVNEEDHLRMQSLRPGLQLQEAYGEVCRLDDLIEANVEYAFHPRWGYLTACPANGGTGVRCSVMMHLPGMVLSRQIERILSAVQEMNLAVRGGQGEGSEITGSLFQISNQATLGVREEETIEHVERQARKIARFEREAREQLMKDSPSLVQDKVFRALGILRTARIISSKEVMEHLSALRLGVGLDLVPDVTYGRIHELMVATRPAHLQKRMGAPMDSSERDIARAEVIRGNLN